MAFPFSSSARRQAKDTVNINSLGDIFQVFASHFLHLIAISRASCCFWTDQNLTGLGHTRQSGSQIGDWAAGGKGPSSTAYSLKAGCPDESGS
jgi:hypothetical protein